MTHRALSRNASSSRAIPLKKQLEMVLDDPAVPISFKQNKAGMQAGDDIAEQDKAREIWLAARDQAMLFAKQLGDLGVHKQYANRLLEPFAHIAVVLTATDWSNFFALRTHKDAQPEFQHLAKLMWREYKKGTPRQLKAGEWHLPFADEDDLDFANRTNTIWKAIRRSVARCARTSYHNHDGTESDFNKDSDLHDKLVTNFPLHASPAEHQAMAVADGTIRSGNLRGWIQYRKTLKGENIEEFYGLEEDF